MNRAFYALRRVTAFALADLVLGHLPRRVSYRLMTAVGSLMATFLPRNLSGLEANLRHVLPDAGDAEIGRLVQRNARNYAKFWVDLFKVPRLRPEVRNSLVKTDGVENLRRVLDQGKGCIVVAIHMGGWEGCASVWGSARSFRSAMIAEVLEPPWLWRRVLRLRQATGVDMIPLGRTAPREILRRLKDNQVVAGAIDRDILGSGKPFRFFDGVIKVPTGLLDVAQRTGSGVLPVICLRDPDDTFRVIGGAPLWITRDQGAVDAAVVELLRFFEDWVRRYPDQWHVMEPIWGADPQEAPARSAAGAPEEAAVG